MGKDIDGYVYGDLQGDTKLKSFMEHNTPPEIDIPGIKKKASLKMHQQEREPRQRHVLIYIDSVAATLPLLIGTKHTVTENAMDGLLRMKVTELTTGVHDEEVEMSVGEKTTLMLADGTRIVANSRITIRYLKRFDGEYREVYVKGETCFDVVRDTGHPFLTHSDNFRVKMLGTRFNVDNYDASDSQIALVQGVVELKATNNDRVCMKPNELVSLQEDNFAEKRAMNTGKYTCWMQGVTNLDGGSVESVVQRPNHYYGVTILFDDEISADKFYGKLILGDRVSEALQSTETMT